jgi:hypothetical protein
MAAKLPTNEHLKGHNCVLQMKFLYGTHFAFSPKAGVGSQPHILQNGFTWFSGKLIGKLL